MISCWCGLGGRWCLFFVWKFCRSVCVMWYMKCVLYCVFWFWNWIWCGWSVILLFVLMRVLLKFVVLCLFVLLFVKCCWCVCVLCLRWSVVCCFCVKVVLILKLVWLVRWDWRCVCRFCFVIVLLVWCGLVICWWFCGV